MSKTIDLPPPHLCHVGTLRKAARRLSMLYDAVVAPCGLKMPQVGILMAVGRAGAPTMGELAATMVLDRSALTENLKPLVRKGLLEVRVCAHDKRIRRVALTEAGAEKLAECLPRWAEAQLRFEAVFGEEEATHLRADLGQIASPDFVGAFDRPAG